MKTTKENCPECKDLPEGSVVTGHDHRMSEVDRLIDEIVVCDFEEAKNLADGPYCVDPEWIRTKLYRVAETVKSKRDQDIKKILEKLYIDQNLDPATRNGYLMAIGDFKKLLSPKPKENDV